MSDGHCLCDGGSYEVQTHPFLIHRHCPIHSPSTYEEATQRLVQAAHNWQEEGFTHWALTPAVEGYKDATEKGDTEILSWKARAEQTYIEWEEANKKIERLEEDVRQYRAMAEAAERERWVDANDYAILKQRVYKLLNQTIEVLGIAIWALDSAELNARIADDEHVRRDVRIGIDKALSELTPLLDNLKALKKEGTE